MFVMNYFSAGKHLVDLPKWSCFLLQSKHMQVNWKLCVWYTEDPAIGAPRMIGFVFNEQSKPRYIKMWWCADTKRWEIKPRSVNHWLHHYYLVGHKINHLFLSVSGCHYIIFCRGYLFLYSSLASNLFMLEKTSTNHSTWRSTKYPIMWTNQNVFRSCQEGQSLVDHIYLQTFFLSGWFGRKVKVSGYNRLPGSRGGRAGGETLWQTRGEFLVSSGSAGAKRLKEFHSLGKTRKGVCIPNSSSVLSGSHQVWFHHLTQPLSPKNTHAKKPLV